MVKTQLIKGLLWAVAGWFLGVVLSASLFAQAPTAPPHDVDWEVWKWSDPEGSEPSKTNQDPGWWQRTWVGWDENGDGRILDGERGILIIIFDFCFNFFMGLGRTVLDFLLSALPQNWKADAAPLGQYISIANTWVPLDFAFSLISAYYLFVVTFIPIKVVVKFVRGA